MNEIQIEKITRKQISQALLKFEIKEGDTLYIRANLGKVGRLDGNFSSTIFGGIMDVLGPNGTLIVPTFTKMSKIWDKDIVTFNEKSPPYSGAFSKRFLRLENVKRSQHPSHSFAAIGNNASYLLDNHDENAPCFEPMRKLAELKGKMMLIGCMEDSPGFSTVHLAQHDLGLSQQHYLKYFYVCNIQDQNSYKAYRPYESPGCSQGFNVFYENYKLSDNYKEGLIGHAETICVKAKEAYETEKTILSKNPLYSLCDDPTCISCYLTRGYNKRGIPAAIWGYFKNFINKNH